MKALRLATIVAASLGAPSVGFADTGPTGGQTGAFTMSYKTGELLGEAASRVESTIPSDEAITWEVYVPETYHPESPPGLFVFVSPVRYGTVPGKWRRVMDRHNLIWISANKSGNRVEVARRLLFAILAIVVAEKNYTVDTERYYVSGFSGGGKVASRIATDYAQTFSGAFYIGGADFWEEDRPRYIDDIRTNRYVFLAGSEDEALRQTRQVFRAYRAAGVDNSELMIIRGMGHRTPTESDFEDAIVFLDSEKPGSETGLKF